MCVKVRQGEFREGEIVLDPRRQVSSGGVKQAVTALPFHSMPDHGATLASTDGETVLHTGLEMRKHAP